jgi:DNA-binding transcriptional regulator GbsR (MarR family)
MALGRIYKEKWVDDAQRQFEKKDFAEEVGLFFEQTGLPRIAGRVLGWLLISDPPYQTLNELMEALRASKGSISTMTRLLIQMGFIERFSLPGQRRDYFRIKPGAWYQITQRHLLQLTSFRQLAERGLGLLKDDDPQLQRRLADVREMYAFFEQELPAVLQRWQQGRD